MPKVEDGSFVAVVDNIEDGIARVLLEYSGKYKCSVQIEESEVPDECCHQDAVFSIVFESGNIEAMEYKPEETEDRKRRLQDRFNRLSERVTTY